MSKRCETAKGPGTVLHIRNATRRTPAWVKVKLDTGAVTYFRPNEVRIENARGGNR